MFEEFIYVFDPVNPAFFSLLPFLIVGIIIILIIIDFVFSSIFSKKPKAMDNKISESVLVSSKEPVFPVSSTSSQKSISGDDNFKQGKKGFSLGRNKDVTVGTDSSKKLDKAEGSLKQLLIKKFQPKIEAQLASSVSIIDLSPDGDNFFATVEISGIKVQLSIDSSGKILDYKKIKAD